MTRWQRIQAAIPESGVLCLTPGENLFYVVGWTPYPDERLTVLAMTRKETVFVVPEVNAEEARAKMAHLPVRLLVYRDADGPASPLAELYRYWTAAGIRGLWMNDTARYDHVRQLTAGLPGDMATHLAAEVMAPLRLAKDAEEIRRLAEVQGMNDQGMAAGFAALRPGVRERDVAEAIRRGFLEAGADRDAFILVAFGAAGAHPHHAAGDAVLEAATPVLLDIGCVKDGYYSDMTRVAYVGEPTPEYLRVHQVVEGAVERALSAAVVGRPVAGVDQAAREWIQAAGYGEAFTHRTGHGIGLEMHEAPSVTHTNPSPIIPGMAFSIEPGVYLPERFGVRLEEVVVVSEQGPRVLSRIPRTIRVVPV